ncbi:MAG: hypothetical protein J0H68_00830 [Sphingobacteriia bacterium]|nr:hypothetical protein [Sphingobacteriia bacterium]
MQSKNIQESIQGKYFQIKGDENFKAATSLIVNFETIFSLTLENLTDLSALTNFTELKKLTLTNCEIDNWEVLTGLKKLVKLELTDSNFSNLEIIKELSNLETIILNETDITDFEVLNSSNFPNIKILGLEGTDFTSFKSISSLKTLEELYITSCVLLNENDWNYLKDLSNLKVIKLSFDDIYIEREKAERFLVPEIILPTASPNIFTIMPATLIERPVYQLFKYSENIVVKVANILAEMHISQNLKFNFKEISDNKIFVEAFSRRLNELKIINQEVLPDSTPATFSERNKRPAESELKRSQEEVKKAKISTLENSKM